MSQANKVLIIDDEESIRVTIKNILPSQNYIIKDASNGKEGLSLTTQFLPDVIVVDYQMPEMNGIEFIKAVKSIHPHIPIIVLTAYGSKEISLKFLKEGAHRYIEKPFDTEELKLTVVDCLEHHQLIKKNHQLENIIRLEDDFPKIIGNSKEMTAVFDLIHKVAQTDISVLILGESGTGKELIAKAVHEKSSCKEGPFIAVNCAGFPDNLIESELFGYERGAFTGAEQTKPGRFELAQNGTIFLDELGELNLSTQAKLLRVLQEKQYERIGGTSSLISNARIVAATNRNLKEMVSEGTFREDLFYRLSAFPIDLPPLRDRQGDIILLANTFLKKFAAKYSKKIKGFTRGATLQMTQYAWKGNIRELENIISRAVILCNDNEISEKYLSLDIESNEEFITKLFEENLTEAQLVKKYAVFIYEKLGRNKNKTCQFLDLNFRTLQNRLS